MDKTDKKSSSELCFCKNPHVSLCWNFNPTLLSSHWELSYNITTPAHATGVFYNYIQLRLGKWIAAKLYLPRLIKPYCSRKPSGYKIWITKKYGLVIRYNESHHSFYYGVNPEDDSQRGHAPYNRKNWFPGYKSTRLVKVTIYSPFGSWANRLVDKNHICGKALSELSKICKQIPKSCVVLIDYDRELINCQYYVREDVYEHGDGYFKWLKWFTKNKKKRYVCLEFDKEVGVEKDSWKGGLCGTTIELQHTYEKPEDAILRWICEEKFKDNKGSNHRIELDIYEWK